MISGSTLYVRTYWGDAYIRWVIRSSNKTEFIKMFGGLSNISDLKVGHIINVQGMMVSGVDTLNVDASVIRDLSLENEDGTFSGKIISVDQASGSFSLISSEGKFIKVKVSSDTTIKKGAIYINISKLAVADRILSVIGSYHQPSETVNASQISVYQDSSVFIPRNFQGKLKALSGVSLPANFTLVVASKEYNVVMSDKVEVLSVKRQPAKLQRFLEGDTVRVYGKIRETDLNTIDAEIVRDLDL